LKIRVISPGALRGKKKQKWKKEISVGVKCVGLFPTPFAARNGTQVPEMDRRDQYNFAENVRDQFFSRKKSASKVA
jgi:hypothetical protein